MDLRSTSSSLEKWTDFWIDKLKHGGIAVGLNISQLGCEISLWITKPHIGSRTDYGYSTDKKKDISLSPYGLLQRQWIIDLFSNINQDSNGIRKTTRQFPYCQRRLGLMPFTAVRTLVPCLGMSGTIITSF